VFLALAGRAQAGECLEHAVVASDLVGADYGSLSVGGGPDIMP
jgi:hypothetical protein